MKIVLMLLLTLALPAFATTIERDVVYGHKDGMALVYDVFKPEKQNGAAVIYMVSGGWFSIWQSPDQRLNQLAPLLDEGFTVVAVHHGSAPRFKVPEAVSDVRAAVRHIKENAKSYGVDPDRLGVWGGSAGGHLTLMLGLNPEGIPDSSGEGRRMLAPSYAVDADDDARVAAIVAFYPPVDIRTRVGPSDRFPALDFPKEQAAAISPILFVTNDDPPTKLIHGDADELVPLRDSEIIDRPHPEAGVSHERLVIIGGDDCFRNPEHRAQAMAAMVDWFKRYLVK